jgi:hypothetical protein
VSKFGKTSVFSELNNLADITLEEDYANICGVTLEDLGRYFGEHIEALAAHESFSASGSLRDEILAWYDGYSWDGKTRVINPFSLLSFLRSKRFAGFWYASGTPTFLISLIKKNPAAYANPVKPRITESLLDSADLDRLGIEPLLFQSGYLTIKEIPPTAGTPVYLLTTPNFEVREAFNLHIVSILTESGDNLAVQARLDIDEALRGGDMPKMLGILRGLFASIPYELHVNKEAYYHSIFYAVMQALGFDVDAEVSVSGGRVDATLALDDKAYVIEFKFKECAPGASAEEKQKLFDDALTEGMAQIKDRGYAKKYAGSGKQVYLAAFAFLGRAEIEMACETVG